MTQSEMRRMILNGAADEARALGWPKNWRKIVSGNDLVELTTDEPEDGSRATRVIMSFGARHPVELTAPSGRFRTWLGAQNLRSTSFRATPRTKGSFKLWHFEGKGFGHGVGMCQWGAKVMSEMA